MARQTVVCPRKQPKSPGLTAEERQLGTVLLHQQLWCFGRDVSRSEGNLLVEYGFARTPPPRGIETGSLYRHQFAAGGMVALRPYGIFWGRRQWGAVWLARHEFRPRWIDHWEYPPRAWQVEQLPPARVPRSEALRRKTHLMLLQLLRWLGSYERWVNQTCGTAYRRQCVLEWSKIAPHTIDADKILPSYRWLVSSLRGKG